jgi:hypothetical protein
MKTPNLLILFVLAILMSCTSKPKNPIEGTWNLVSFKMTFPDSTFMEYPGNGSPLKTFHGICFCRGIGVNCSELRS